MMAYQSVISKVKLYGYSFERNVLRYPLRRIGQKPKWGYFPNDGHPEVVTRFEGTKATPEFLQAIAYEVYVIFMRTAPRGVRSWSTSWVTQS